MTLAVTLTLFLAAGFAVALSIPQALPRFVAGRIGAIFLLGAGACGALLFLLGAAGVPLGRATFAAVPAAALVIALMQRDAARRFVAHTRVRGDLHETLSTLVILLPFATILWTTTIVPLSDYDGRTAWIAKASAIARERSIRGPFFHGQRGLNLHNRYPLLMPLDAAALVSLTGRDDAFRPLYALLPAALLLAVRDLLSRRGGTAASSWCLAAVAWLPQMTVAPEGGAASAYSDLALAAFFGMAIATLVSGGRRAAGTAGLWIAFAILTKNEGALLALAALAALCFLRPRVRWIARFAVAPVLAIALLVAWQQSVPEAYDERNAALAVGLLRNLGRLDDAVVAIARHAIDWQTWGVFWPAVLVAGAFARRRALVALIALAVTLAGYVAVLACTSWSIEELARVTANRLLVHCVVAGAALVVGSRMVRSSEPRCGASALHDP